MEFTDLAWLPPDSAVCLRANQRCSCAARGRSDNGCHLRIRPSAAASQARSACTATFLYPSDHGKCYMV